MCMIMEKKEIWVQQLDRVPRKILQFICFFENYQQSTFQFDEIIYKAPNVMPKPKETDWERTES